MESTTAEDSTVDLKVTTAELACLARLCYADSTVQRSTRLYKYLQEAWFTAVQDSLLADIKTTIYAGRRVFLTDPRRGDKVRLSCDRTAVNGPAFIVAVNDSEYKYAWFHQAIKVFFTGNEGQPVFVDAYELTPSEGL